MNLTRVCACVPRQYADCALLSHKLTTIAISSISLELPKMLVISCTSPPLFLSAKLSLACFLVSAGGCCHFALLYCSRARFSLLAFAAAAVLCCCSVAVVFDSSVSSVAAVAVSSSISLSAPSTSACARIVSANDAWSQPQLLHRHSWYGQQQRAATRL